MYTREVKTYDNPGFIYTTPSAITRKNLTSKARREIGCVEKPKKKYCYKAEDGKQHCASTLLEAEEAADGGEIFEKTELKFTGSRCPDKSTNCSKSSQVYDDRCKSKGDPCGSERSTCPVQLVWVAGKPNLRFCMEKKKPGYLVPVRDVAQAMEISDKACANWPYKLGAQQVAEGSEESGWDAEFFDRNRTEEVDIPAMAKAAYPERNGLGNMPSARRGNPVWIAAGVAMGVMAAVLMKQKSTTTMQT